MVLGLVDDSLRCNSGITALSWLFLASVAKERPEARSSVSHFPHRYVPSSVIAQGRPLELPIRPGQLRQTHRESLGGNYSDPWKFAESRTEHSVSRPQARSKPDYTGAAGRTDLQYRAG